MTFELRTSDTAGTKPCDEQGMAEDGRELIVIGLRMCRRNECVAFQVVQTDDERVVYTHGDVGGAGSQA